jgi:beta-glucosidase
MTTEVEGHSPGAATLSLVAAMTLDEKAAITAGQDLWTVPGVERLGIPSLAVTDGPNGARGTSLPGPDAAPTACVPCGSALGATWDPELLRRVGALLGQETRARSCRVLLAPTVNIPRSPLAGRNFECYSEDPHLSGILAAAFIRGAQSQDVATTVKHFVGNDAETERYTMSSVIDERSLREIYLVPFEHAVRQGGTLGVMTGYNRLNGKWCSEDRRLLTDILRDEWGFDGFVLTDWYGVASSVDSQAAGVDLEMPGPGRAYGAALADAVRRGLVPEEALDAQVGRLLSVYARLGLLDGEGGGEPPPRPTVSRRMSLAREAAAASMVLLRNNGLLPLDDAMRTMAVIGAHAARAAIMGGGSANVMPDHETSPVDALRARLGPEVTVLHEQGVDLARGAAPLPLAMTADYIEGHGLHGPVVHRGELRATEMSCIGAPAPGLDGPFSVRATGVFLPTESGRHLLTLTHVGRARILVDGVVVLDGFDETLPRGPSFLGLGSEELSHEAQWEAGHPVELTVEYDNRGAKGLFAFRLACRWLAPDDLAERAVAAAAAAEVAVVVVGTSAQWESEGFDRPALGLPRHQDELVARIAGANPNTVVVVNTGAPVTMPWAGDVAAVLQAWFGGQEMATALADVLFGASDPGGRLPVTIPARVEDTPAYGNFPGERDEVRYGEGLFVGYRWYESRRIPVTFPFGHGLSYSTFALGAPELSSSAFTPGGELVLRVPVANTGGRAGTEVVQCYVAPPPGGLLRPEKELKAFAKISLDGGETGTVTMVLSDRAFAYWDPGTTETVRLRERMALGTMLPSGEPGRGAGWRVDPGPYELWVGRSSADIAWRLPVTVGPSSEPEPSG